jgi:hypothetical protein
VNIDFNKSYLCGQEVSVATLIIKRPKQPKKLDVMITVEHKCSRLTFRFKQPLTERHASVLLFRATYQYT